MPSARPWPCIPPPCLRPCPVLTLAFFACVAVQNKIIYDGNQLYLKEAFPHMSYIKTEAVTVLEP